MPRYGMVIDLDRCNGCSACVVACQAENNIPVAGPEEAARGGAIAWLRIERHLVGRWPDLRAVFLPVPCQHCEAPPCVPACPVGAAGERPDGINTTDQSACQGLRLCARACPYGARHINHTTPSWDEPLDRQLNPDVATRERGHIESCTFCAHRVDRARDTARAAGREPADGEIAPACAQSCPTRAIVFGDLDDPDSRVARGRGDARAFTLLSDRGSRPRVTYLRPSPPRDADVV